MKTPAICRCSIGNTLNYLQKRECVNPSKSVPSAYFLANFPFNNNFVGNDFPHDKTLFFWWYFLCICKTSTFSGKLKVIKWRCHVLQLIVEPVWDTDSAAVTCNLSGANGKQLLAVYGTYASHLGCSVAWGRRCPAARARRKDLSRSLE